jgi:hypothetical protein
MVSSSTGALVAAGSLQPFTLAQKAQIGYITEDENPKGQKAQIGYIKEDENPNPRRSLAGLLLLSQRIHLVAKNRTQERNTEKRDTENQSFHRSCF